MCGIAGSINCKLTIDDIASIRHRGPDSQDLIQTDCGKNAVFFGHTRLSILDLSEAGNQPMFSDCGDYCIIFNGEIYNHLELRAKLHSVAFAGHSDTETILYYLKEFGISAVKDFNGIFAFAFLDRRAEKIYLVRDHFGIKPLYYFLKGDKLIFGSEIKIIKNHEVYNQDIDLSALNTFLTFRYNPSPQTLFKDIKKLAPATYLEYNSNGKATLCNYWQKVQNINARVSEKEAIDEYKRLLSQAVKRQLLSDVSVGLLLSGGIDSAVLGSLMSEYSAEKIKTFTIGFEGKGRFNELHDAAKTAEHIKSDHHEITMDRHQYMKYFYKAFYHTEEPIAEPTIPALFCVSNLASKHVKVVISGQGADETLAGYKRYRGEKILTDYQKLLSYLPLSAISKLFPYSSSISRGVYSSQFKEELDKFIGIYTLFTPELKDKLFKADFHHFLNENQRGLFIDHYNRTSPDTDSLSRLLFLDTRVMLPDNLLLFNDKLTMANSIENRVPYLDIDLVNFIESLPIGLKLRGKTGKYIHRKAVEEWLPKFIINRKKRAFETPVGEWFKDELSQSLTDLIDSSDSFSRKFFNVEFIKHMIVQNKSKRANYRRHLFIIFSLELWYKKFYTKETRSTALVSMQF